MTRIMTTTTMIMMMMIISNLSSPGIELISQIEEESQGPEEDKNEFWQVPLTLVFFSARVLLRLVFKNRHFNMQNVCLFVKSVTAHPKKTSFVVVNLLLLICCC